MKIEGAEGFILAGGKSSRMGSPKALLEVGGSPIIVRTADVLNELFTRVRVITERPEELGFLGLDILPDIHPGRGPLGGLHAALSAASAPVVVIVSSDLPFLTADLIRALRKLHTSAPATVPSTDGLPHPLCGFYERRLLMNAERAITAGDLSLQHFLQKVKARIVPPTDLPGLNLDKLLFNVNTPEDLEKARSLEGPG